MGGIIKENNMILRDWKKYEKNPIWKMKEYTEDFVVVQNPENKKYYAFFTYGIEKNQKLGLAVADSPLGSFKKYEKNPIFNKNMRIGSIIAPCKLTNSKWRLYYNSINEWEKRTINFIESNNLINWFNDTETKIPFEEGYLAQPACQIVDNQFLLLVTKVLKNNLFVDNYWSDDGINFYVKNINPLISPKSKTEYSLKIGNPSFICEDGINIFNEGNSGPGWQIFQTVWKGEEIKTLDEPLFSPITANPYITRFHNKYYLYYGELVNPGQENCYYQVNVVYQNVI